MTSPSHGEDCGFKSHWAHIDCMISENFKEAIKTIYGKLSSSKIKWAFVGSTNMQLQGIQVIPRDLDVVMQYQNLIEMPKLFYDYSASPVKELNSFTGRKVWEVTATINNVGVQFNGSENKDVYVSKLLANKLVLIDLDNVKIPCFTLEAESQTYRETNRHNKADIIKKFLSTRSRQI